MSVTPPSHASIKVIKSFSYRGGTKLWSNRYFFTNDAPTTAGRWLALSDAVVLAEKAQHGTHVTIVETVGYAGGSDVPVYSKSYTTAGTMAITLLGQAPGDAAMLVRYSTADRSTKNHPIYLFNYYHGIILAAIASPDTVLPGQVTLAQAYANSWVTGFSDGTVNHVRTGPDGHTATGALVSSVVKHRDFPAG